MANGIVLGGALNCRESTSKDSTSLGRFSTGDILSVSSSSDADWYQTTMNGTVGYVMKAYVAVANDTVKVNASNVNVRDGSSTSGTNVLYRLSSPTTATVLSVTENWVQIQPSGKSSGWIHAKYVNKSASGTGDDGGDTGGETGGGSTGSTEDPTYTAGDFGRTTKTAVRLRKSPSSNDFVQVVKGSMFMIEGTETGTTISGSSSKLWVKIRFGKGDGTHETRYVHSSCFGETCTMIQNLQARMVTIAQTLVNNTGGNLGMSGDWCQRFIYLLLAASGMDVSGFPYDTGYCGQARLRMVTSGKGTWHPCGEDYTPAAGDLIYYGEADADTSRHVGIVVVGGSNFKTVEGNMGGNTNQTLNKVKLYSGSVSTGKCNNSSYQGFLHIEK